MRNNQVYYYNGCLFVPATSAPMGAGPFLPNAYNSIEQHLIVPPAYDDECGTRKYRVDPDKMPAMELSASRIDGQSMTDRGILNGDFILHRRSEFSYVVNGEISVVERLGDEEGTGAWSLKKLLIDRPNSSNDLWLTDDIGSDEPTVLLKSYNKKFNPWSLDKSGQYLVRGVLAGVIHAEDAYLVDSDVLRDVIRRKSSLY